jgi:hypothetical protein
VTLFEAICVGLPLVAIPLWLFLRWRRRDRGDG